MIHFVEALTSFDVGVISTTCNDPVTPEPVTLNGVQVDGVGNPDAYQGESQLADCFPLQLSHTRGFVQVMIKNKQTNKQKKKNKTKKKKKSLQP